MKQQAASSRRFIESLVKAAGAGAVVVPLVLAWRRGAAARRKLGQRTRQTTRTTARVQPDRRWDICRLPVCHLLVYRWSV